MQKQGSENRLLISEAGCNSTDRTSTSASLSGSASPKKKQKKELKKRSEVK